METKPTIGERLKSVFFNEFRFAMIALGTFALFAYPIAMAWAAKDLTYLYIGIAAWGLFALALYGMYKRFKPYYSKELLDASRRTGTD